METSGREFDIAKLPALLIGDGGKFAVPRLRLRWPLSATNANQRFRYRSERENTSQQAEGPFRRHFFLFAAD